MTLAPSQHSKPFLQNPDVLSVDSNAPVSSKRSYKIHWIVLTLAFVMSTIQWILWFMPRFFNLGCPDDDDRWSRTEYTVCLSSQVLPKNAATNGERGPKTTTTSCAERDQVNPNQSKHSTITVCWAKLDARRGVGIRKGRVWQRSSSLLRMQKSRCRSRDV